MELFLSVSRTASFTETGRTFGVSSTLVSRAITDLEDYLKVKLLVRSTRQVALSEAGEEYARHLEGILWSLKEAESNVTAISSSLTGHLRVHSRVMFGLGVLTPLIAEFRALHPDIRIELTLGETKADLRRQQFDIDFRIAPPQEAGVRRRMLFTSERYLVASPDYLEAMPGPARPAALSDYACLAYMLPGDSYVWRFRCAEGVIEEVPITPRHVSNNGVVLLELARLGEGIALLDDYTVAEDLERGTLVRLLPQYRVSNTTFEDGMFATILDTPLVPAKIRAFLDFVSARVSGKERRFAAFGRKAADPRDVAEAASE